ncbi:hypothetical protein ACFTAO_30780 [Paenibacillus rhizoplanae]
MNNIKGAASGMNRETAPSYTLEYNGRPLEERSGIIQPWKL